MAHLYSVCIHEFISEKIRIANQGIQHAQDKNDAETIGFYKGQLEELLMLRKYLSEKIDLKTQTYY